MDAILLEKVALTLLKNLGSSFRSARNRGREPANHSETTAFCPSPGKFKPKKFAKTDVVECNAYFTSSVMAAFLDTVSLAYRSRASPLPLANVVDMLTPTGRKFI
ncbi:hypothetical protein E2C01_062952 [Portunus trituberculatus]|uniref:Uncharacterized protein n=1 Tax=Portunus trituberculatus TaxID=210409 RepID=A0A5B7HJH6_PORTR|nr:hypothetical protein [Portunus trituberculatus]